jgi:hypothetical protein
MLAPMRIVVVEATVLGIVAMRISVLGIMLESSRLLPESMYLNSGT